MEGEFISVMTHKKFHANRNITGYLILVHYHWSWNCVVWTSLCIVIFLGAFGEWRSTCSHMFFHAVNANFNGNLSLILVLLNCRHKTRLHIGQLVKNTSAKLKQASETDHHVEVSVSLLPCSPLMWQQSFPPLISCFLSCPIYRLQRLLVLYVFLIIFEVYEYNIKVNDWKRKFLVARHLYRDKYERWSSLPQSPIIIDLIILFLAGKQEENRC